MEGAPISFSLSQNEMAQSTNVHEDPYVNYLLHTGVMTVEQAKYRLCALCPRQSLFYVSSGLKSLEQFLGLL